MKTKIVQVFVVKSQFSKEEVSLCLCLYWLKESRKEKESKKKMFGKNAKNGVRTWDLKHTQTQPQSHLPIALGHQFRYYLPFLFIYSNFVHFPYLKLLSLLQLIFRGLFSFSIFPKLVLV